MNNLVEVKNIDMHFPLTDSLTGKVNGYIYALNNVSLNIKKSEILGLVGESGSGKSTLGKCILKLNNPTCGNIYFDGKNTITLKKDELKKFRKNAQIVFQNPYTSLDPRMKIYDILKEPLIIHGEKNIQKIDEEIKKVLEYTGFGSEVLYRFPHEFSGGQRQRLAIARAVILNPEFIVADEPVSALDVSIQAQIINMLVDLKKQLNLTILFISHDLNVVKFISDRIAVMYAGEIVETAPKNKFFAAYKHPYSYALLSAIPDTVGGTKNKIITEGDLPSPSERTTGCKFHTRCPYAFDKCKKEHPELKEISSEHFVRCFLSETVCKSVFE